ncbi:hypothetical protein HaLaN_24767 [Haematococcus lacustris]|uniref:Uncharacterized protein n=1 Tax=Haematococcus lacustris TaxID=44745 RepID=A0A699ZVA7_HAELA|nr:hypothetical protein HaLaN_24767 [Haematococcus lacustris]
MAPKLKQSLLTLILQPIDAAAREAAVARDVAADLKENGLPLQRERTMSSQVTRWTQARHVRHADMPVDMATLG